MAERILDLSQISAEVHSIGRPGGIPIGTHRVRYRTRPTENAELRIELGESIPIERMWPLLTVVPSPEMDSHAETEHNQTYEARILNNLLLASQFAYGNADSKKMLITAASLRYDGDELRREFGLFARLQTRLSSQVSELSRNVKDFNGNFDPEEIQDSLQVQLRILEPHFLPAAWLRPDKMISNFVSRTLDEQTADITTRMATVDLKIYENGGRDPQTDEPFEGYVKRFVIDNESTGSADFDALFQSYYNMVIWSLYYDPNFSQDPNIPRFKDLSAQMKRVQKKWQATHPGEPFYRQISVVA